MSFSHSHKHGLSRLSSLSLSVCYVCMDPSCHSEYQLLSDQERGGGEGEGRRTREEKEKKRQKKGEVVQVILDACLHFGHQEERS